MKLITKTVVMTCITLDHEEMVSLKEFIGAMLHYLRIDGAPYVAEDQLALLSELIHQMEGNDDARGSGSIAGPWYRDRDTRNHTEEEVTHDLG